MRDASVTHLRQRLYAARHHRRLLRYADDNFAELVKLNKQFALLLDDHHAVGALDGALVGDTCPVCKKSGVTYPDPLIAPLPTTLDPALISYRTIV